MEEREPWGPERQRAEEFLHNLFVEISQLAQRQEMTEMATFKGGKIERVSSSEGREFSVVEHDLELTEGAIFGKKGLTLGLALGKGRRSKYEYGEMPTRLLFGVFGVSIKQLGLPDLSSLGLLVCEHPIMPERCTGEFYYQPDYQPDGRNFGVSCIHDTRIHGGEGLASPWSGWNQKRLLSDEGFKACLKLVAMTIERTKFSTEHPRLSPFT